VARLETTGSPDVIRIVDIAPTVPGAHDVWIEQEAIGVNYLDVMQRNGSVPIPLPSGLGLEGAGRVAAVGPDVKDVAVGDRVAYAMGAIGSYASGRLYPAERLVKLPESLSFDDAAAVLFKGLTAQYLIKSTYPVQPGTIVLLYGAAGALGQILAPWIAYLGGTVVGVVSKPDSVERARAAGCAHVLVWDEDLPTAVGEITAGRMADVVYDGIGRTTFAASMVSLRPRGMMVSIGASSGLPDPVSIKTLNEKSLFLTRPSVAAYTRDPEEYQARAADLFDAVANGVVKPSIWKSFALSEVAKAHAALETGQSAGAILLKP
jgi:NADPH2:quinone reductase